MLSAAVSPVRQLSLALLAPTPKHYSWLGINQSSLPVALYHTAQLPAHHQLAPAVT